jgi:hypothetical protein
MNHPAEMKLHRYMTDAANGKSTISEEVIQKIGSDIMDALRRHFGGVVHFSSPSSSSMSIKSSTTSISSSGISS